MGDLGWCQWINWVRVFTSWCHELPYMNLRLRDYFAHNSKEDPRQSRSYGYSRQFIRRNEVIRQALL